jgi:lambda family phage portal protein
MRDRARDLVRNNPHAAKALSVIVSNKIGTGIICSPADTMLGGRRPNLRKNARLAERWKRWIENCDVTGKLNLYAVQELAERTRAEAGEALIRFIPWSMNGPMDVPFRLMVLEPDYIDTTRHLVMDNGNIVKHGIEYQQNRPVAYWLYDSHPGDDSPRSLRRGYQSTPVPASEVLHYYKPLRPGQTRGMTDFAPVMLRLLALDDYDNAEVMRKKVSACLAAFVTTASGLPAASLTRTETDDDGNRREYLEPGLISYLKPGESVATADPKPSSDYRDFTTVQLHAIAAGLDMPYELLSTDLREVNYTSHRGGLVQFRGMIEKDQWNWLIPQVCRPICDRFTLEAASVDSAIAPGVMWTYTPPRFGLLDPAKEIPAQVEAIQSGLMSYQTTMRRDGYDPGEMLDEIEAFQKEAKRRGISLTSIPPMQQAEGTTDEPQEETDETAAA